MQQFDAIFKIFGRAIFEAMEVKGLRFEVVEVTLRLRPRNFEIIPESLAANLEKVRQTSV